MKTPALRSVMTCAAFAVLTFPIGRSTRTAPPDGAGTLPVGGWDAVERQVEEDSVGYQRRASAGLQRVAEHVRQLEALCADTAAQRPYLGARVRALREHLEYARAELLQLPSSTGQDGFTLAHAHFHRTVKHLDSALAQLTAECADR